VAEGGGVLSFQFHPADDNHFNEYSALPLMALAADFISVPSSLQQQEHNRR